LKNFGRKKSLSKQIKGNSKGKDEIQAKNSQRINESIIGISSNTSPLL